MGDFKRACCGEPIVGGCECGPGSVKSQDSTRENRFADFFDEVSEEVLKAIYTDFERDPLQDLALLFDVAGVPCPEYIRSEDFRYMVKTDGTRGSPLWEVVRNGEMVVLLMMMCPNGECGPKSDALTARVMSRIWEAAGFTQVLVINARMECKRKKASKKKQDKGNTEAGCAGVPPDTRLMSGGLSKVRLYWKRGIFILTMRECDDHRLFWA